MTETTSSRATTAMLSCTVGGVPLLIARSWLAALALTTIACSAAVHAILPALSLKLAGTLGLVLALAFTISLVVHELAHAVVARKAGIDIDHIRLFAGGALCRRKHAIDSPRPQFLVAAAGPLASTALAVGALGVALGAGGLGFAPLVNTALWLLAFMNILIAAANLLPVLPFDGGKLVHSLLWRGGRDQREATDRLQRGGREFSRVIAALGFLLVASGSEILIGFVVLLLGIYLLHLPSPA